MINLRWYGVAGSSTGYAVETRSFVDALRHGGHLVDFHEIPTDYALVPSEDPDPVGDLDVSTPADAVVVSHPWPGFPAAAGGPPVVWRTMFETDRAPAFFAAQAARASAVWVPSRFCREVLVDSGIPGERLYVLPPCPPEHIAAAQPAVRAPGEVFTFLSIFRWQLRKGWDVLVDAFATEFRDTENVRLVIKADPFDAAFPRVPHRQLADRLAELRRRLNRPTPPIALHVDELTPAGLVALYRSADAFVLPSRGEGWGLPTFEAMALGIPTIGTRWGGSLDYLTDDNAYLIDARRAPVGAAAVAEWPLFDGGHWAEPSPEHLRSLMRTVYEHPERAWATAARASREIRVEYSPQRTADRLASHVGALA